MEDYEGDTVQAEMGGRSRFTLPHEIKQTPDGRLIKETYIPARVETREVEPAEAVREVLLEKLMSTRTLREGALMINWNTPHLQPALDFFEEASNFAQSLGTSLQEAYEGLAEQVRARCNEGDKGVMVNLGG